MGTYLAGYTFPFLKHGARIATKHVAYMDNQGHIQELTFSTFTNWRVDDLTSITGAPLGDLSSRAVAGYYWSNEDTMQVAYIDINGHIQELVYDDISRGWSINDLTSISGAPQADRSNRSSGGIGGYEWPLAGSEQVVYIDNYAHIQELVNFRNQQWSVHDLTSIAGGGPLPFSRGGAIAGYIWSSGGTKQVVYIDFAGHIQELIVGLGQQWSVNDLTSITGAPRAISGVIAGYDWLDVGTKQVVYIDNAGHIQELVVGPDQQWSVHDLTSITGASAVKFLPKILDFRGTPTNAAGYPEITAGNVATLSWHVESFGAMDTKVSIQASAVDHSYTWNQGGLPLSGSLNVTPNVTTEYQIGAFTPSFGQGVGDSFTTIVFVLPGVPGGGTPNPPSCAWFYFEMDNSQSAVLPCFMAAACAADAATAQQILESQNGGYTATQVDYGTYLQGCS